MAIIKEIHFSRTKSFGDYENVRIGAVAEVVYPKTEDNVLVDLKEWVDAKISEEVSKPVVEMKTEELKQLEGYVAERREALKALEAEIKAKRGELDRCIEVGMRSLFVTLGPYKEVRLSCGHSFRCEFSQHEKGQTAWCAKCGNYVEVAKIVDTVTGKEYDKL